MEQKQVDSMQEALRIVFLNTVDKDTSERGLSFILSEEPVTEMSIEQKTKLLNNLATISKEQSLGQVIRKKLTEADITPAQLAVKTSIPVKVVEELLNDKIYTNNVPVVLFRNVLRLLNISFQEVEKAILKTFDMLQRSLSTSSSSASLYPALRKNSGTERQSHIEMSLESGKELYENREALNKYVNRLQELMNQ